MNNNTDEYGRDPADAVTLVREFVAQQLREGQHPEALSFALAFIAIEMGLTVVLGRYPLGVLRTALRGVVTVVSKSDFAGPIHAATGAERTELQITEVIPKDVVIH